MVALNTEAHTIISDGLPYRTVAACRRMTGSAGTNNNTHKHAQSRHTQILTHSCDTHSCQRAFAFPHRHTQPTAQVCAPEGFITGTSPYPDSIVSRMSELRRRWCMRLCSFLRSSRVRVLREGGQGEDWVRRTSQSVVLAHFGRCRFPLTSAAASLIRS